MPMSPKQQRRMEAKRRYRQRRRWRQACADVVAAMQAFSRAVADAAITLQAQNQR